MADIVDYRWSPSPQLYRMTRGAIGPLLKRYFHMEWQGVEHIPASGAVVLACNHLSNLDPVLLAVACPRQINYLAKIELFKVPILGGLIRGYGAIPLRRSAADPEAIRLAEQVLMQEQLLALFPEGTRSRDGTLKPFRFGAARLSLKYEAALVPAVIIGTERAMPAGGKLPQRVPIKLAFGPPINTSQYHYRSTGGVPEAHILESVTTQLRDEVQRLKTTLEQADASGSA